MKIKKGFMMRKIQDTAVVVPFGADSVDFNNIMNLNETGAFIWSKLEEDTTEEAVVKALTAMYDIDEKTASADVSEFIEALRKNNLIDE
ncbi:MAG: PqqD family protein [Clostridiales bacterium]|nr:PqqD family protein [Clostridiales bacterium]